jgi:streptogramin lyase
VAKVYAQLALIGGPMPYTPGLPSIPHTWFLGLFHGLGTGVQPYELAVDASGNAYVADQGISPSLGGIVKLTPSGSVSEFTTDASSPFGIAVTSGGDLWVTNDTNGTLVEYNSSGTVIGGPITGLNQPRTVAIDLTGNLWVANAGGNSVLKYSSAGVLSNTFSSKGINTPYDVAVDSSGSVWIANEASNSISMISGTTVTPFTGAGVSTPKGIVADNLGNIWVGSFDATTRVSKFTSSGKPVGAFPGGGTGRVLRLASDGAANLWAADFDSQAVTELTSDGVAVSPPAGFISRSLIKAPQSIAIDASGNIWVSDLENDGVAEFIGAAVPVKTPLIGPAMLP